MQLLDRFWSFVAAIVTAQPLLARLLDWPGLEKFIMEITSGALAVLFVGILVASTERKSE